MKKLAVLKRELLDQYCGRERTMCDPLALTGDDEEPAQPEHERFVGGGATAEEAVTEVIEELAQTFEALVEEFGKRKTSRMRRARRLGACALSQPPSPVPAGDEGRWVVAARKLVPSQLAKLDLTYVAGLLTEKGTPSSQAAILARARGIPAVVVPPSFWDELRHGDAVIVDGTEGEIIVRPNDETLARYMRRRLGMAKADTRWRDADPSPAITMDGHAVLVGADVGSVDEAWQAAEVGADAIGTLSTELLYREFDHPPTEVEERDMYAEIVYAFPDKPLLFRTLDVNRNNPEPWRGAEGEGQSEANSLFGMRGIRFCLENPDVFRTHLRAIFQAVPDQVLIMFPMVTTVIELRQARRLLDEVYDELVAGSIDVPKSVLVGVMVETPAAALAADKYAPYVDFFCLGTDNLLQFGLGIDGSSARSVGLYMPYHPGMLRMMADFVRRAHASAKPVSVCGEMASDPLAVALFLGLGVKAFSVPPDNVPRIKSVIRALRMDEAQGIIQEVLEAVDAETSFRLLERWYYDAIEVVV